MFTARYFSRKEFHIIYSSIYFQNCFQNNHCVFKSFTVFCIFKVFTNNVSISTSFFHLVLLKKARHSLNTFLSAPFNCAVKWNLLVFPEFQNHHNSTVLPVSIITTLPWQQDYRILGLVSWDVGVGIRSFHCVDPCL